MSGSLLQLTAAWIGTRFIKADQMVEAILLGLVAEKNVIFFGPGGHAKSELVRALLDELLQLDPALKTFGGGTTEDALYGGYDLGLMKSTGELKFRFAGSWMDREVAVFEELFDAPPRVLTSLKNTLTAARFEDDTIRYPMSTKSIVALTNLEPGAIAAVGADVEALVQRFPIQLRVAWGSYTPSDYSELFKVVGARSASNVKPEELRRLLAEAKERAKTVRSHRMEPILSDLLAKAAKDSPISPRTAMHALGLCKSAAAIAGRVEVQREDLVALRYLPGAEDIAADIRKEIDAAVERAESEARLRAAEVEATKLRSAMAGVVAAKVPVKALQLARLASAAADAAGSLAVTDGFAPRRKQLVESLQALAAEAESVAKDATNVGTVDDLLASLQATRRERRA